MGHGSHERRYPMHDNAMYDCMILNHLLTMLTVVHFLFEGISKIRPKSFLIATQLSNDSRASIIQVCVHHKGAMWEPDLTG